MVESQAAPTHPFVCKMLDGTIVGGSYDNISAVTIGCTIFAMLQDASPTVGTHQISVLDDAGTVIAVVGKAPDG